MNERSAHRLCIYCASSFGRDPAFEASARTVGELMVGRGIDLVYGGGHVGLMGVVADVAMSGGRHVIGVIPQNLMDAEVGHSGVSDLRVVDDMPSRKQVMYTEADAFLTLPGGVGTMEEMYGGTTGDIDGDGDIDVLLVDLARSALLPFVNDGLIDFLADSVDQGLTRQKALDLLMIDDDPERLLDRLLPPGV